MRVGVCVGCVGWVGDLTQQGDGDSGDDSDVDGDVVGPLHGDHGAPTQDLDGSQLRARLGTNMTPVREHHFANRIEDTPCGADRDVYKYYCPLCMFYLRSTPTSVAQPWISAARVQVFTIDTARVACACRRPCLVLLRSLRVHVVRSAVPAR